MDYGVWDMEQDPGCTIQDQGIKKIGKEEIGDQRLKDIEIGDWKTKKDKFEIMR